MSFAAGTKAWPVMAHAMVAKRVNCSKMSSRHLEGNTGSDQDTGIVWIHRCG